MEATSCCLWWPGGRIRALRSDHIPSTRGIARRSDPSGDKERDKWPSAD